MAEPDEQVEIVKASSEPISPELVLVSPELAERVRAELPERPWEAFASAPAVETPPAGQPTDERPAQLSASPPRLVLPAPRRRAAPPVRERVPPERRTDESPARPKPRTPAAFQRQPASPAPPPRPRQPTRRPRATPPAAPARPPLRPPVPQATAPVDAAPRQAPAFPVIPSAAATVEAGREPARPIRHRRRRFPIGQVGLLAAISALLAVGSLPPRDAPTFAFTPPTRGPRAATSAAPAHAVRSRNKPAPKPLATQRIRTDRPAGGSAGTPPETASKQPTWSVVKPTKPKLRTATPVRKSPTRLQPHGAYALGSGGTLRVARGGRAIARLITTLPCLGQLIAYDIPVRADGGFRIRRLAGGRGTVTVSIEGRFVSARAVQGTIRAHSTITGCDSGAVPFRGSSASSG
jgi:hypothetical protein